MHHWPGSPTSSASRRSSGSPTAAGRRWPHPPRGFTIGLNQGAEAGDAGATPVFGVKDIDAARSELEAKGVTFEGETVELPGMVKLATFVDPDGNHYMFAQSLMKG